MFGFTFQHKVYNLSKVCEIMFDLVVYVRF